MTLPSPDTHPTLPTRFKGMSGVTWKDDGVCEGRGTGPGRQSCLLQTGDVAIWRAALILLCLASPRPWLSGHVYQLC